MFFGPETTQTNQNATNNPTDTIKNTQIRTKPSTDSVSPAIDSTQKTTDLTNQFGKFVALASGTTEDVTVITDEHTFIFSSKGAAIKTAFLNKFLTSDKKQYPIFPDDSNNCLALQFVHQNRLIETKNLYFNVFRKPIQKISGAKTDYLVFRAVLDSAKYIEVSYLFTGNRYDVTCQYRFVGLGEFITNNHFDIHFATDIPKTEKSKQNMLPEVTTYYNYADDVEKLDAASEDIEKEQITGSVKWVAHKSQFFKATVIAQNTFESDSLQLNPKPKKSHNVKYLESFLQVPYHHAPSDTTSFRLYLGPNDFYVLRDYDIDLEHQVYLGYGPMRWINRFIILPCFNLLQDATSNYGLIILILAILIKIITLPFTYKSSMSQIKMKIVNELPEMKSLEAKHKDEPSKLQTEKMALLNRLNVNPFGGCLPMLLQLPVLIAMFSFFPASIQLRQKSFLWADDLSTYDSIYDFGFEIPFYGDHVSLFTLLMTLSTLLYTYLTQQAQGTDRNPQMAQFKYMSYIMPVIFLGILNNYSAGLSYYYLLANLLSIAQTYLMKLFVDEKKIAAEIEGAKKNKNSKPTGLAAWIAEQQRKQQNTLNSNRKK